MMSLLFAVTLPPSTFEDMDKRQVASLSKTLIGSDEAENYVSGWIEYAPPVGKPYWHFVTRPERRGDLCVRHHVRFEKLSEGGARRLDLPKVALGVNRAGRWESCENRAWINGSADEKTKVHAERLLEILRGAGKTRSGDYELVGDAERANALLAGIQLGGLYRIDSKKGETRWQFSRQRHARLGSIEIIYRYRAGEADSVEVREPHRI